MQSYFIVLPVDTIDVGHAYDKLPLHCTVMPWFKTRKSPEEVLQCVHWEARRSGPIILKRKGMAFIGINQDVPVDLVDLNPNLSTLHIRLFAHLRDFGVEFLYPQWVDLGYRPHITRVDSRQMQAGIDIWSNALYCIQQMDHDQLKRKKAIAAFALT